MQAAFVLGFILFEKIKNKLSDSRYVKRNIAEKSKYYKHIFTSFSILFHIYYTPLFPQLQRSSPVVCIINLDFCNVK